MAKTVDNFSTIEDFRKTYNELAFDVGDISGLRDALKAGNNDTIVDAINVLEDKQFFFQEFEFIATTNQVSFNGADAGGNTLIFKDEKVQVFKNEEHLRENVDYQVALPSGSSHTGITLIGNYASGQSKAMASGDRLTIYSFTGAFIGTNITGDVSSFFQKTAENTIQNINANGVILNGDNSSATTTLESGFTLQLAGRTFAEDDIITTTAGKKFQAPIMSDGVASLQSGSLTSAVNGTFSGTVQAEQLTTTDDLSVGDDASITGDTTIGGSLGVTGTTTLSGNLVANGSVDLGNAISDTITFNGTVDSHITPSSNNTQKVGNTTRIFLAMHATDFHGNLTGDVTGNVTGDLTGDVKHGGSVVLDASSGALTGTVSSISNHSTTNLSEGDNQYFTNARADGRADTRIAASNIGALANVTTSSLANGDVLEYNGSVFANTNLEEKVEDIINGALVGGTNITVTYDDSAGTLTIDNDNTADITGVTAGDGLIGGGSSGDVTLNVKVDDSSLEISSDTVQVKSSGITNAMLAGSIANSKLSASSITINGTAVSLGGTRTLDTGDLAEDGNLFFTNARADARIAAANISDLNDVGSTSGASSGQILVFDSNGDLQVANNSTGTDSISEQTNKYFTDDRVAQIFKLDDNGDGGDDTELSKGIKLTYTDNADGGSDTSLDGRIAVELEVGSLGGLSIPTSGSDANKVQLDYSVITDSDLSGGLPSGSGKDVGHLYFLI